MSPTPPPLTAKLATIGVTALAHNLGLVLRGHGRHQVIRICAAIPKTVQDMFDNPDSKLLNPDRETRELLLAQGPLPTVGTIERALLFSEAVLIAAGTHHAKVWLDRLEATKPTRPLPVVVVTDDALTKIELRRLLRPRVGLRLGYQNVSVWHASIATDLATPKGPITIVSDHQEVHTLMERVWRPVINTIPVIKESL